MVLLLSSNFAYRTALSAAEQHYCRIPRGCKVSASSRTDIATKPTATDPSISRKPTSEVQPGPAASMLAGKGVQVNVLPGKLSITPGLYAATSWGLLRIRNWQQKQVGRAGLRPESPLGQLVQSMDWPESSYWLPPAGNDPSLGKQRGSREGHGCTDRLGRAIPGRCQGLRTLSAPWCGCRWAGGEHTHAQERCHRGL